MQSDPASRAGAILEIDLGAIVANWRVLAAKAAPAACAAVVKANGYGLGAVQVARSLLAAGCRKFYVATLEEGVALRSALGPEPEIAVFNGPPSGTGAEFVAAHLTPVLNDPGQIETWESVSIGPEKSAAIIHVDTGLNRLGLSQAELMTFAERLCQPPYSMLISHLACAETPGHPLNPIQRDRFVADRRLLPGTSAGPRRLVWHLSRCRLPFRRSPSGRRALWRQPLSGSAKPDAAGGAVERKGCAVAPN